ncbi:cytochrome b5-like Heme/Steroid binding domain protein [Oesophagostomum dentatum]|uniref:Cytochrome b5-like Heme/Steroid binding domain protein n=1 Tax=Oesophagostomum dentatum TaxID=61180 RepID=A0A0B1SMC8_OESDE|nr:cytochrome b5-like Heme/Steroid binding domain protein [Oesophagostomum dentatum]
MDWIRLASEKILAKKHMSVDHEELTKHNKKDDCWILIFGQVYDVTSYLEFHPGGIPELMRAAGTDGTDLFNQYHAWVNYESMLKSCLVGRFTGDVAKLPQPGPSTIDQPLSVSAQLNALIMKGKQNQEMETYGVKIEKDTNSVSLTCEHWNNLRLENVVVDWSSTKKCLRILVRPVGSAVIEVKWGNI